MPPKVEVGGCGSGCGTQHARGGAEALIQIDRKPDANGSVNGTKARTREPSVRGGSSSPMRSL